MLVLPFSTSTDTFFCIAGTADHSTLSDCCHTCSLFHDKTGTISIPGPSGSGRSSVLFSHHIPSWSITLPSNNHPTITLGSPSYYCLFHQFCNCVANGFLAQKRWISIDDMNNSQTSKMASICPVFCLLSTKESSW